MRIGEVGGLPAGLVQGAREKTLLSLASSYSTCVVNRMLYLAAQHPHFLFLFYAGICPSTFQSRSFRETSHHPHPQLAEVNGHIPSQRKCLEIGHMTQLEEMRCVFLRKNLLSASEKASGGNTFTCFGQGGVKL